MKSRRVHHGMQVIFENEVERSNSGGTGELDSLIYTGRINRHIEGKRYGEVRSRGGRI